MKRIYSNQLLKLLIIIIISITVFNSCKSSSSDKEIDYSFKIIKNSDSDTYIKTILVVLNKDKSVRMYDDRVDYSYDEGFLRYSFYALKIYSHITSSDGYGNYKFAKEIFGTSKKVKFENITSSQIDSLNNYINLAFKLPILGAEQSNNPVLKRINKIYYDVEGYEEISQKEKKYGFQTYLLNNGSIEYKNSPFGGIIEKNPRVMFKSGYSNETVIDDY